MNYDYIELLITRSILFEIETLLSNCKNGEDYTIIWDSFWVLSAVIPVTIDYPDPDTTYEEDILSRYEAIKDYLLERGMYL